MNEKYAAKHTENATDLYGLRQTWLAETDINASAFESVEERLNAGLCLIACNLQSETAESAFAPAENKKEPSKEAECFVYLACRINAENPEIGHTAYDLAYQWLALDTEKSAAAEAALSLYPQGDQSKLLKLYEEQEALRPNLFRLFRKQMQTLPLAMVSTAASSDNTSAELKIEALHYAAANPDLGLDLFRSHYLALLSGYTQFEESIVEAALWGGLVRSDPDASKALSIALSHAGAATEQATLLRLAALSGAAEFLPLLLQAAENDPDSGYPLLVLFGQKSVIPELLKALEIAHTLEQSASAFEQLTDQILPRVPRLSVVGKETDDAGESPEPIPDTLIPDVRAAHAWWKQNQTIWKTDERWLYGKPTTSAHLTALTKKHAGQFGCDLMALLQLSNQAPLNIPFETWRARQTQLLDAPINAKPNASKQTSQAATKSTSTRHA